MLPAPIPAEWPVPRVSPGQNSRKPIPERIRELRSSIDQHGLLQPIGVIDRADDNLIFGFQRFFAHLEEPAIRTIRVQVYPADTTPLQAMLLNGIENLTRTDLTDAEEYHFCKGLLDASGWKRQDLAHHLGKSPGWVTMVLAADDVVAEVREAFLRGLIGKTKVYRISKFPKEQQTAKLGKTRRQLDGEHAEQKNGEKPSSTVRTNQVRLPLGEGFQFAIRGPALSLDAAIARAEQAIDMMKQARAARHDARSIRTWLVNKKPKQERKGKG